MTPLPIRFSGLAALFPGRAVGAAEIDARLGIEPGWTAGHTGVLTRYQADGEGTAAVAAAVGRMALDDAGVAPEELGVIVNGSAMIQQPIPSTAALVAAELGAAVRGVPAFDVNATCLSFVVALDVASRMLGPERRHALVVAAELGSPGMNPKQPESYGLMGDGAAAVVLSYDPEGDARILASRMETYADGGEHVAVEGGGTKIPAWGLTPANEDRFRFRMDGRRLVQFALGAAPAFMDRFLGEAGLTLADVDLVVPHQASLPAVELLRRKLDIPEEKYVVNADRVGNTIAASIPIALHEAVTTGRLKRGSTALLVGTSAGLSIGGLAIRY